VAKGHYFRGDDVLDYALFVKARLMGKAVDTGTEADKRAWMQASICSLAKYWDTPDEGVAWAYLQTDDLADEREFWYRLSDQVLALAYSDDEPDYRMLR